MDDTTKGGNHGSRVAALFDEVDRLVPGSIPEKAWLGELRTRALAKRAGWKNQLEAYLRGLRSASHITSTVFDARCRDMERCVDARPTLLHYLVPLVWTLCAGVAALAWFIVGISWSTLALMFLAAGGTGAAWAWQSGWLPASGPPGKANWAGIVMIAALGAAAPPVLWFVSGVAGCLAQKSSVYQFKRDRALFERDPQGFQMIRQYARANFGVDVVLGDEDDGWITTALRLPGASVANMSTHQGYCELNMYRENVLRVFAPPENANAASWLQGVMIHELAHCLDIARDLPALGGATVHKNSIAPDHARAITDVQSYHVASMDPATKLWREALGDTMAVGFWRLAAPLESAAMAARLRRLRLDNAASDPIHATLCWIDAARKAEPPAAAKDLLTWADRVRGEALCGARGGATRG